MSQEIFQLSELAVGQTGSVKCGTTDLGFEYHRLSKGQSAGVELVRLICGAQQVDVLPTRGMGIWQARNEGVRFGWDSPIAGPIHPMWVPIHEPSGLGWLDGFDEMMVRCGLASNGAPEFDEQGRLVWPLHGRIANLPASDVRIEIDRANERIAIRGTVREARFHFRRLQMETEIALDRDSNQISVLDRVTNQSQRPTSIQMLYHNNFGAPLLEPGSRLHAPVKKLVPRNQHSAAGLDTWNTFGPPESGFEEQVYFLELAADADHRTLVVLSDKNQTKGVSLEYDTTQLPYFSVWKNSVGLADGHVLGMEPATNFPNPRSFEASHGRVKPLGPGESCEFGLNIGMLTGSATVTGAIDRVEALSVENIDYHSQPHSNWCSPD